MFHKSLALLTTMALLSGCASLPESLVFGGTVGATAGGIVGNGMGRDARSTAIGAIIGTGLGALIGYFGYKDKKQKDQELAAKKNAAQVKPKYPTVSAPVVRAVWVPDRIENDQYVAGHYIYVIDKPATFRKE